MDELKLRKLLSVLNKVEFMEPVAEGECHPLCPVCRETSGHQEGCALREAIESTIAQLATVRQGKGL